MGHEFTPFQCRFSPANGFRKAIFFLKVSGHYVLNSFFEVETLAVCVFCQTRLQIRLEVDFHALKIAAQWCLEKILERPQAR
jgi:hypothetical protein